jgi:mevalonate kinase
MSGILKVDTLKVFTARAPGKVILFGEHAVVYGQPALAVPVSQVQATAVVTPGGDGFWIEARDLGRHYRLEDAPAGDPLAQVTDLVRARAGLARLPAGRLTVTSTIPIASGLGSGASIATAAARALALWLGLALGAAEVSALVFETEKLLHGTPSGIDNTVVAFGQPVYFVKGQPPEPFTVARPFQLLIGDTGHPSPTKITVGDVRAAYECEPERYGRLFAAVGDLARQARNQIETGRPAELGPLMHSNHALLQALGVSSPELDRLVAAAGQAGALGAKLSGGGRGGNMLALVKRESQAGVAAALRAAGAVGVIATTVE